MYKYIFIECEADGLFNASNYREVIEEYSKKGYRFVSAIPSRSNGHGKIRNFDLVFEIEE